MYSGALVEDAFKIQTIYTAFERRFSANYAFKGEYHNFYELVVVADGTLGVAAGSKVLKLVKGQAILHEPMEFHNVWSEEKTEPHVFIISFQAEHMPPHYEKIFQIEDLQAVSQLVAKIRSAFLVQEDFKIQRKPVDIGQDWQLAVKNLEIFLLRMLATEQVEQSGNIQGRMAKNYAKALRILETNIHESLSVEQVAQRCNMSAISLQKTFARHAGTGVIRYFNRLKITAAMQLLKDGVTAKECAKQLGFQNQNYFSTVFKRVSGMSPGDYKKSFGEIKRI